MARPRYHLVFTRVWSNPDFRARTPDARDAWIYLLTSPHRTTEGLFRLPIPLAAYDLQWTTERTALAFSELEQAGFIALDHDAALVWLVNAVAWNNPRGPKQVQGAVNALAEVPPSALRSLYLARCRQANADLADAIAAQLGWAEYPIETVSEGLPYPSDCSFSTSTSTSSPPSPPAATDDGPPPPDSELVALADQVVQAALQDPTALADAAHRQAVAEVLAVGHPPSALLAAGADAAGGRHPLALLRAILRRLAAGPPDTTEPRPLLHDQRPPCPNPACVDGWLGGIGPDGRPETPERCPDCTGVRA